MKQLFALFFALLVSATALAADKPDVLVDADWLASKLNDPKLVILEVRYYPHRHHTVGHIPGAVQVQRFADLGANDDMPIMKFPSREAFQATLRRWGVNDDSTIVVYDDAVTALASRVLFLLDLYGFDMQRVKLLDGGTVGWTGFNELTKTASAPKKPGKVTLKTPAPTRTVGWTDVYRRVVAARDEKITLIDARPADMYDGTRIQHSVQGGHIPGAINIVSLQGADGQSQQWKSLDELAALYKAVPKDSTVITYCHDGFRSTLAWLQLKSLGYLDVRVYNGGWADWDRTLTLPIVKGNRPFDADFEL
ncbi:MAG: rhodanese-like domain-containing protein [Rhodocyclaceae bacterium]|nr:rhodanese-like domain-containing protein [Rhodocyclaceae bacterium]MDZ4215132.1 rhodanese-like domain-containing protein [Rhodocyclaceae bacterium]